MGWQWHQLDHTQIICTSLQTDNHANTSPFSFYRSDALPAAQPTASKHWRHTLPYWHSGKGVQSKTPENHSYCRRLTEYNICCARRQYCPMISSDSSSQLHRSNSVAATVTSNHFSRQQSLTYVSAAIKLKPSTNILYHGITSPVAIHQDIHHHKWHNTEQINTGWCNRARF